ncbi:SIR2 family NAD-dependent protein deacylase [Microcella flavibacter]|uniref:SIR2 family NAD-dependent protein deacylase n=1 Tax=Microcella flavibacter TaxID=1804990 RepID=UPI00145699FF|nr:SIR2 family protein [Microcella flavibacter]
MFVVHGDLTELACDAIMIPTDARLSLREHWHGVVPEHGELRDDPSLERFRAQGELAHVLEAGTSDPHAPLRVLTAVPLSGFVNADALRPRVLAFIERAARRIPSHRESRVGTGQARELPLVAMPLFGVGGGGGGMRRTRVLDVILAAARDGAREHGVDVALVLRTEPDAALAQQRRHEVPDESWRAIDDRLLVLARDLADKARAGRLVPFIGAGVSVSAGAPTWGQLLEQLCDRLDLPPHLRAAVLDGGLSPLDQASYLRSAFEQEGLDFRTTVAEIVERQRYGLAPALLAAAAGEQAITLNYDTLFERASTNAGRPRRVISGTDALSERTPEDSGVATADSDRWLLKLHGTASDPGSIVLTREDYLGFAAERSALSAIVKATLITRHLLFVGFGLADDHFHEIMHDVRRAVGSSPGMATALSLFENPLADGLWAGTLRFEPMEHGAFSQDALPRAARNLELLLDAVAAHAADSRSYLMSSEHEDGLSESELRTRELLQELGRIAPEALPDWCRPRREDS